MSRNFNKNYAADFVLKNPSCKKVSVCLWTAVKKIREVIADEICFCRDLRATDQQITRNFRNRDGIFVWIPKSAGHSIAGEMEKWSAVKIFRADSLEKLPRFSGIYSLSHLSMDALLKADIVAEDFFHRAWKFAFVRNPFDRAVSLFEYLRSGGFLPQETTFSIFCEFLSQRAFSEIGLFHQISLSHLNPQVKWIRSGERVFVDFIGHLEHLAEDFEVVRRRFDAPPVSDFGKLNESKRKPLECYYENREEIEIVREVYAEDFEVLGYSTDLSKLAPVVRSQEEIMRRVRQFDCFGGAKKNVPSADSSATGR